LTGPATARAPAAKAELLYQINFPERPGALGDFLAHINDAWNISLFHYRGMGGDTGHVLIGFETNDADALESKLATSYDFTRITSQAAQVFLGQNSQPHPA